MQINTIQEIYFDYYVINSNLFHLGIESCISNLSLTNPDKWNRYDESQFNRITDGLISICLSNRVFPIIKFVANSPICTLISKKVSSFFEDNYDFIRKECSKEENGILFIFGKSIFDTSLYLSSIILRSFLGAFIS